MDNVDKIKRGEPVQNPDKIMSMKVARRREVRLSSCALAQTLRAL